MLRDAAIVCFSSIDWTFNWQNPQEVASAFAESGNRVLFIENTGVRRPAIRDAARLWTRFRNWRRAAGGVKAAGNGVDVFSPLLLPFPYSRLAGMINRRILLRVVRRWLGPNHRPLIFITFLPTPLARALIGGLEPALVVYYCCDRLTESSPQAGKLRHFEPKLLVECDLALVTSNGLRSLVTSLAPRVEMLPSGVRFEAFARAQRSDAEPPAVFNGLALPVVGFVGSLRKQIDLELLARVADLAPDLNFVFVGPIMTDVRRLTARANVRLAGPVPHHEVMSYMVRFDAGVLPYILDKFTAHLMPAKLKEYLAAGLPVVATPLPAVRDFARQHPGMIEFASDAAGFADAVRAAVVSNDAAAVARRTAVARQYDWSEQLSRIMALMESLLDAPIRRGP